MSFNNTQKRKSRRSKCEKKLERLLRDEFPHLVLLPNNKTALDGLELDLWFPDLKLGIEWNGVVHFKPIYGHQKLSAVQARDAEKQQRANKKGIHLIVIPDLVSTDAKVREAFMDLCRIIRQLQT